MRICWTSCWFLSLEYINYIIIYRYLKMKPIDIIRTRLQTQSLRSYFVLHALSNTQVRHIFRWSKSWIIHDDHCECVIYFRTTRTFGSTGKPRVPRHERTSGACGSTRDQGRHGIHRCKRHKRRAGYDHLDIYQYFNSTHIY